MNDPITVATSAATDRNDLALLVGRWCAPARIFIVVLRPGSHLDPQYLSAFGATGTAVGLLLSRESDAQNVLLPPRWTWLRL